ncbi:hypothetical protein I6B53_00435 [Schaalia sp. 19OD2882]|uniref:DUF7919 family protein n=1 Tax=Schaalia sp. 19OD2882 TaxID=2794089 RepID=UPI001C1EE56B|nr:hypothetical protein [Schaalia sp. 19OD2882]QWW19649.1 hypothetical protein I6B53_00435 [Schaalia sp. 19OD2882]
MPHIPDGTPMELGEPLPWRPSLWDRIRGRGREPEVTFTCIRAFGWLSAEHTFPTGKVPAGLLETLEEAARERVWGIRCYYTSDFAPGKPMPLIYRSTNGTLRLGDAGLLVVDDEGQPWVAPNLVLHYVRDLGYLPPFTPHLPSWEMLAAVRRLDSPPPCK